MTDLMRLYAEQRERGLGHHAAVRAVAGLIGVDKDTVARGLRRARVEHGPAWPDAPWSGYATR